MTKAKPRIYQPRKVTDGAFARRVERSIREGTRASFAPQVGDVVPADIIPVIEDAFIIGDLSVTVESAADPKNWFVIRTQPNSEARVERGLLEIGVKPYLPLMREWRPVKRVVKGR